ncbi:MAG: DEAD/DEAH box helicase [Calditrichae bacterium]|nr:DEAD/DEAH box helicase [Calditrichia bacterium]
MDRLGLSEAVLNGVKELGFENPTPVQEQVIPLLLQNKTDLVALAQTGTGKTAAYGLPIIERIDVNSNYTQALILSPTRELCIQITKDLTQYAKYIEGISITAVYGGADMNRQIKALQKGVQIIVATPGRMLDLINRGIADVTTIDTLVLDEADEMLNMGFQEDLNAILFETPKTKNTLLFSATMPREAEKIASDYMTDPVKITIGKRNSGAENVEHIYYMVHAKDRYLALKRIADLHPDIYGIIFCRTRKETKDFADKLIQDGYDADSLHGDLTQQQRDSVMRKFRQRNLQMLIATDVAARGLDVNDLTHVINVDLPDDLEIYTHRSGRTGRAGKDGVSITIMHSREKGKLRQIEKIIGKTFEHRLIPTGQEICEKQLFHLIDKMQNVQVNHEQIDPYLPAVYEKLESLSKEDLIKNFVALEFNRFLEYYKDAQDINYVDSPSRDRGDRRERGERGERGSKRARKERRQTGFDRFFIDAGSKDDLNPGQLISLINRQTRNRDIEIGKIEIMKSFSFFEIDDYHSEHIVRAFKGATFNGKKLQVEPAQSKSHKDEKPSRDRGFAKKKKRGSRERFF